MRPGPVHPPAVRTAITRTRIIDGSGGPEYLGDVLLKDGNISEILAPGGFQDDGATVVIDGAGLVTCPGFINLRGTSALAPFLDPTRHGALTQGVTTEAVGRDGAECAPLPDAAGLQRSHTDVTQEWAERGIPWRSVSQYLSRVDHGTGTNIAYLAPLESLRSFAGTAMPLEPTPGQLVAEVKALADALEQGAFGLFSPRDDSVGTMAGNTELEALGAVVAAYDGCWASFPVSSVVAVPAALRRDVGLAAKSGVRLHLGDLCADDHSLQELLSLLDEHTSAGPGLSFDSHPYQDRPGTLVSLLPAWAQAGRPKDVLARLENAGGSARIRAELAAAESIDWAAVTIAGVSSGRLSMLVGQDVARIAAIQSSDPVTTMLRILCTDALSTAILHRSGTAEALRGIAVHRAHAGAGPSSATGQHPGMWGAFARFVGREARDAGLMDLTSMIHQLTGRPASILNLADRGVLAVGMAADVLVFDADAIIDMATFADPRQPAAGIHHVFVNGAPAVTAQLPTSALAGRALRRGSEGTTKTP